MKKVRFVAPFAALATVAVIVARARGHGCRSAGEAARRLSAGLVSDVGRFNDKGFNQNQLVGLKYAQLHIPGLTTTALESHSAGEYMPNFASLARKGVNIIIGAGLPARGPGGNGREAVPEHEVRDHRLHGARRAVRRQEGEPAVQERRGPDVRDAGELVPRRVHRALDGEDQGRRPDDQRRRRRQDPAGRHVPRRLSGRREGMRPGRSRCSSATRRTSSTRRSARRSRRTRSTAARRSCSRSPAPAASARSTPRSRPASGASASTSTSRTSARTS